MQRRKVLALFITFTLIFTVLAHPLYVYGLGQGRGGNSGESETGHYGQGGSEGSGTGDHETEEGVPHDDSDEHGSSGKGQGKGGPPAGAGSGEHDDENHEHDDEDHEGSGHKGGSSGSGKGQGGSGSAGNGRGGAGGGKPPVSKGSVLLEVTVEGLKPLREVYVTLYNSDSSTTVKTIESVATFYTEPGDEWMIRGEAIPGYDVPEKSVKQIIGTDEFVTETLTYEVGGADAESVELNKTSVVLFNEDSVQLTAKVLPGNANQEVTWSSSDESVAGVTEDGMVIAEDEGFTVITATAQVVGGEDVTASCNVTVLPSTDAIPVTGVTVEENQITLILRTDDNEAQLHEKVLPNDATVQDVIWKSDDEKVATVDENGKVTGVAPGSTVITVTTIDGGFEAYTRVSVCEPAEIEYIYPTLENEVVTEHFENPYVVYINVVNLVNKLTDEGSMTDEGVLYYVKVMEKGSTVPLGEGQIELYSDTREFNLYDETLFKETDNFSSRYFVYMSQYEDYPKDDEKTLMTNFMGGTATPTIPKENVVVNLKVYGGGSPEGIIFLLAREEIDDNKTIAEISWRDFYIDGYDQSPADPDDVGVDDWVDEVKMVGVTNLNGVIDWIEPRETLKLGGYLLLEVTPLGYEDNLGDIDPSSDDGELLKQVHLMRGGSIYREVVNTFVGGHLNAEENITNTLDDSPEIEPETPLTSVSLNSTEETLVTLNEVEKYSGHWAKESLDNIVQKGRLKKDVFPQDVSLNADIDKDNLLNLIHSISQKDKPIDNELGLENNTLITREQSTVMVMEAFGFGKLENPELAFVDNGDIDDNTKGYIGMATEMGIINGYPDNTFKPKSTITIAELFTMISRCLNIAE